MWVVHKYTPIKYGVCIVWCLFDLNEGWIGCNAAFGSKADVRLIKNPGDSAQQHECAGGAGF
jgi:hypothetical protein